MMLETPFLNSQEQYAKRLEYLRRKGLLSPWTDRTLDPKKIPPGRMWLNRHKIGIK